jgi:hypothetical protein
MSDITPGSRKRSYPLPPGCKDLVDVLKAKAQPQGPGKVAGLHPISTEHVFINGKIRAREVQVCDEAGGALGILSLGDALALAERSNLDLVLVNAKVTPPLCVLIDYGKYRYQQSKKKKRRNTTS